MFNKVKDNERFCFKCPFCGKENSFGFKYAELKKHSKREKEEIMERTRQELPDIQLVESWGCLNCEMRHYSIAEDYEKRYLKLKEHFITREQYEQLKKDMES